MQPPNLEVSVCVVCSVVLSVASENELTHTESTNARSSEHTHTLSECTFPCVEPWAAINLAPRGAVGRQGCSAVDVAEPCITPATHSCFVLVRL